MDEDFCSEYLDFAVETYRHASRYGDSPCDCHFLPRRGVFFWPMEMSALDKRRFRLWTRVLRQMVKDNILIPVLDPKKRNDFRDAHYRFHRNYFRPPYFKGEKIYWPHVKEWYFEYMNNKSDSAILNEAMTRLENYLEVRDRMEKKENEENKASCQFQTTQNRQEQPQASPNLTRFPYVSKQSHSEFLKFSASNFEAGESSRNSENNSTTLRFSGPAFTSSYEAKSKLNASPIASPIEANRSDSAHPGPSNSEFVTCRGCLRCAHGLDYPDDLFEGRIITSRRSNDTTQLKCDYIICLECNKIYDHLQTDSFKFHLDSPEHTSNVLSRLKLSGKIPTMTTNTQKRLESLEKYVAERGYASISEYMRKTHHLPQNNTIHSQYMPSKNPSATKKPDIAPHLNPAAKSSNKDYFTKICPQRHVSDAESQLNTSDNEVEPDILADNDMKSQLYFLRSQQKKIDGRLKSIETGMKSTQVMLKGLEYQVETGSNRTQALVRSFIRHDDAIKLLQNDAVQGKAITDIMEGAIDAMNGGMIGGEAVSDRLGRQEKELEGVRRDLQKKVEDLSSWLKVIDRHTNEIMSLKQKIWVNGQVNNPSDSNRFLVQKLEHQIKFQQDATKSLMMKTEQRFEAMIRRHSEEINSLKRRDEDKQKQIINLKAQAGLKFAHLEEKTASLRRSRK